MGVPVVVGMTQWVHLGGHVCTSECTPAICEPVGVLNGVSKSERVCSEWHIAINIS